MRRKPVRSIQCTHPGCGEWSRYQYDSQREYNEDSPRFDAATFKCHRHRVSGEELTLSNTHRVVRAVARRSDKYPQLKDLFWHIDNSALVSGFMSGEGFNASAENFPEGTVIEMTYRVILPGSDQ